MTFTDPNILFVSHQASRTGAPIVLLNLMRWIKANTSVRFHTLLLTGGPLEARFAELGPVTRMEDIPFGGKLQFIERRLHHYGFERAGGIAGKVLTRSLASLSGFDLIYLNSAGSISALRHLPPVPGVFMHVHELGTGLKISLPAHVRSVFPRHLRRRLLVGHVDRFIAAASCVRDVLVEGHAIPPERIVVQPEFIDVDATIAAAGDTRGAKRRALLRIPSEAKVIVAAGTSEWRKGPDLFIQLARRILSATTNEEIYFVWVGVNKEDPTYGPLEHDVRRLGLEDRVRFVSSTDARFEYLVMGNVFALTSREDPFPLVALEATALGLPVVSFDSGGMREFLRDGAGIVVDLLDVERMADSILMLLSDGDRSKRLVSVAAERLRAENSIEVGAARIYEELTRAARTLRSA